jgi:DUF1680 family protein
MKFESKINMYSNAMILTFLVGTFRTTETRQMLKMCCLFADFLYNSREVELRHFKLHSKYKLSVPL